MEAYPPATNEASFQEIAAIGENRCNLKYSVCFNVDLYLDGGLSCFRPIRTTIDPG